MTRHSIFAALHQSGTSPDLRGLRLAAVAEIIGRGLLTKTALRRARMLAPSAYPGGAS